MPVAKGSKQVGGAKKGSTYTKMLPTDDMSTEQKIAMLCANRVRRDSRMAATAILNLSPNGLFKDTVKRLLVIADNPGVEPKDQVAALREIAQIAKFAAQMKIDGMKEMTKIVSEIAKATMTRKDDDGTADDGAFSRLFADTTSVQASDNAQG